MGRVRGIVMVACAIVMLSTSAVAQHAIAFEGVSRVTHLSTSGMNLWVEVTLNRSAVVVKSAEVGVMSEGSELVTISLRDKVVARGHRRSEVLIPLRFKARSSLVLNSLLRRMAEGDTEGLTLSYNIRAGGRLLKRCFAEEGVAMTQMLDTLGITGEMIDELQQYIE